MAENPRAHWMPKNRNGRAAKKGRARRGRGSFCPGQVEEKDERERVEVTGCRTLSITERKGILAL